MSIPTITPSPHLRPVDLSRRTPGPVRRGRRPFPWRMFVRALLLVCTLASAYYAYVGYVKQESGALERKMEDEARAQLIADVAQVFDVPPDEVPRIATIKSTETLSGNAFFADAAVGDKLLVYCVSGRTVLFRPSTRSVINSLMSPLDGVCPQK